MSDGTADFNAGKLIFWFSCDFFRFMARQNAILMVQSCVYYTCASSAICKKVRKANEMKAVITVIGKDKCGIIGAAGVECSKYGANIEEISQTVLDEYFSMIMLVSIEGLTVDFSTFAEAMSELGRKVGVDIRVMHEDIFNSMHRI